ncbi:MAG TPA: glycoside hydrolase family 19 protein [Blastocatellia bacterium]|nr:glycoside hydrolase family 19 protein [Blastocatellia bacterium]
MIADDQLARIATALTPEQRSAYLDPLNAALSEFEINTPLRQAAFLAQTAHESQNFTRLVENLNYSAKRLTQVWPKRFPTLQKAQPYANNPQKLANFTYGGRNGNGPEASGDGWKYRGRGFIQITGRSNYQACSDGLGADFISDPDKLAQPDFAFRSAAWFWRTNGLNGLADKADLKTITIRINGGTVGLDERIKLYNKVKAILGI